jgi:hypothetical protein
MFNSVAIEPSDGATMDEEIGVMNVKPDMINVTYAYQHPQESHWQKF